MRAFRVAARNKGIGSPVDNHCIFPKIFFGSKIYLSNQIIVSWSMYIGRLPLTSTVPLSEAAVIYDYLLAMLLW